ncbi:hypothetical protein AMAG_08320 [Allomyces macrogynus ATCC 38327]|uniref:Uncharacterized protein n=1 Tax=Allomyces macrogynus (strain ATCC 38327) TaxID=578462 RepID=A0A0L0SKV9_ALLM3|nr:hypothetical protein AMAG_08320 [Allomyces macrogynus ATCC 38327]|eukprot:KNE63162.1 hypothetical protein AMAG_08320 [Allomyces macrogynus ATCC 38327]
MLPQLTRPARRPNAEYQPSGTKPLYSPRTVPRASTTPVAAATTASSLSPAWLSPTQASSTTRSAVTIADHLQWDFVRHDPDLTAALALFRRVLADRAAALPLGSPHIAPVQVPPLATKTAVPWSATSLVRVARQLAHRLLKAETEPSQEGDSDDTWEPTWTAPSRVWSPTPPNVQVDSGTWTDVVRLYQEAVQVAHREAGRASSARAHPAHDTPLHTLTHHDHNLILSALHRVGSEHSAPPTVWPGLGRDGAPYRAATAVTWYRRMQMHRIRLAAGTDAAAIVIYHLTTAHNNAPHVRDLLARLAAAGISDSPLDGAVAAAQLERAVHAYAIAIRAHIDHAARGKAHALYFDSIRAGLRVPADVPLALLAAHLAANDVDAAVHLFITSHDHVPGFPAAFTQNGGPDPSRLAAATLPARRAHRTPAAGGSSGGADVTLVSPWHVMCHAALDTEHVDLVRLMARTLSAALDATPERGDEGFSLPEVSLVTLARALDMLGRRGLVEDAARLVECAVALQSRMASHGLVVGEEEQRAWVRYAVDAFGRGVERMGGAHARRQMVAELEERVRVGRGGKGRE